MSHRVTTETSMTDKQVVMKVAKAQGISFTEDGANNIRFTSGPMRNATLDVKTGRITGDTDYGHTTSGLGALRQAYSEELCLREMLKQGHQVEERGTMTYQGQKGVIRLLVSTG